jgi:hypothetical protein
MERKLEILGRLWKSLNYSKMTTLSDEEFQKVLLDRWSHVGKKGT